MLQGRHNKVKTADAELSRIQAFVLDPINPLLHLLERLHQAEDGEGISFEEMIHGAQEALRLIGNAFSQISTTRRKKVLKALNPDIQDLATEEGHFKESAPRASAIRDGVREGYEG